MKIQRLVVPAVKGFAGLCAGAVGGFGLANSGGVDGALIPAASAALVGSGALLMKQAVVEVREVFNED